MRRCRSRTSANWLVAALRFCSDASLARASPRRAMTGDSTDVDDGRPSDLGISCCWSGGGDASTAGRRLCCAFADVGAGVDDGRPCDLGKRGCWSDGGGATTAWCRSCEAGGVDGSGPGSRCCGSAYDSLTSERGRRDDCCVSCVGGRPSDLVRSGSRSRSGGGGWPDTCSNSSRGWTGENMLGPYAPSDIIGWSVGIGYWSRTGSPAVLVGTSVFSRSSSDSGSAKNPAWRLCGVAISRTLGYGK